MTEQTLVRQQPLRVLGDARGALIAIEGGITVPFDIQRVYYIYGTLPGVVRGLHAHKSLQQFVVCVAGRCKFLLDDGVNREEIMLDSPAFGLYIDPMVWHEMSEFSPDCVLVVLADQHYDEVDYIRDYERFKAVVG